MRLNKFLAERLGISRRLADVLIGSGVVRIGEKTAKLGQRIDFFSNVCYNEKMGSFAEVRRQLRSGEDGFLGLPDDFEEKLKLLQKGISPEKTEYIYLAMNKPEGYVCSKRRQDESPTIYELLPEKWQDLKTVGRLDKASSGLILLTNDGDFAYQMTHPRFTKLKIYEVELDHPLSALHQQEIAEFGIEIGDGVSKLGLEKMNDNRKYWRVFMSEGRNRQIRRTFGALGYTVVKLHRVQFGPYRLSGLAEGETVKINR